MKKLLASLAIMIAVIFCTAACSKGGNTNPPGVKTYVLVHGAWQGPWVWEAVKKDLEKSKQKVIVVELPGHGSDNSSPAGLTIDVYRQKVISAISGINGKIILVGHSMGGVVVSAVAESIPDRIEKLIYIGAFVPANGQSLLDLALTDKQSLLGPSLIPSKDQLTLDIVHDQIIPIFCQDATAEVQRQMLSNYRVEPAIPFANKITLTDANFGRVDKYYIHTLMDHAIGADLQNHMVETAHITKLYSINTSHSPFLVEPDELAALLLTIGK